MDMDLIRFALGGVDFTFGMDEVIVPAGNFAGRYRHLHMGGELDIDIAAMIPNLGRVHNNGEAGTQTGDIVLRRTGADYGVFIDIGATMDIWTAHPDLMPDHVREHHPVGIPAFLTEEHRAHAGLGGGILYIENFILNIKHFLHTSGNDMVRDIISVDFTPDATEWADGWGYNWLALHPTTPVDLDAFEANYQSNMFTTQTGDVFIATYRTFIRSVGDIYLYIDLGSVYEMFGAEQVAYWRVQGYELTEADRMFHRVQLLSAWYPVD